MIWYGIESLDFGGLYHTTLDGFGGTILQCSFQGLEGTIQLLIISLVAHPHPPLSSFISNPSPQTQGLIL